MLSYHRFHIKTVAAVAVAVSTSVLGSQGVFGQSTFIVPSGETREITEEDRQMLVNKWIMEDSSTVIIRQGITKWTINALEASFGKNTRIIGTGTLGIDGTTSQQHGGNGGECKDGGAGGNGDPGTHGGQGVDISITMGLVEIDELFIDVRGGGGGNGGHGANGGKGGRASCGRICSGQEGGRGGRGGDAGNGGNGGKVEVQYWVAGTTPISFSNNRSVRGLRIDATGGEPGQPGIGGRGGDGGDGKRCPPFNSIRRGSGHGGENGVDGNVGQPGQQGSVTLSAIPNPGP